MLGIFVFLLLVPALFDLKAKSHGIPVSPSGYALLVNTWDDFPESNATDVPAMPSQILQAYYTLKNLGYDDTRITLLLYHSSQDFIDFNSDGLNDLNQAIIDVENNAINKTRLSQELSRITSLLNGTAEQMIIYVVGHGSLGPPSSYLTFENGDSLSCNEFAEWLGNFSCAQTVFLLDFCYSGNFANALVDKPNRLIVTSSDSIHESWYYWNWNLNSSDRVVYGSSGSAFFHPFWKRLDEGATIQGAFSYAREMCLHWGDIDSEGKNIATTQNPQIISTLTLESEEIHVCLSKESTSFRSSSYYVNDIATLRVYVESTAQNETELSIRAFGKGVDIAPSGWQTFVIQPMKKVYFDFGVSSTELGDFPVTVELKHNFQVVDFTTVTLHIGEPLRIEWRVLTSYDFRLSLIYVLAVFTIVIIYVRYRVEDDKQFNNYLFYLTLLWGAVGILGILSGLIPDILHLAISPGIERIETILAVAFILCMSGLLLLVYRKFEYSTIVGNIILFLISIPIVVDWLARPLFPWPEELGGSVFWQVLSTIISVILGIFIDRAIKGRWRPRFLRTVQKHQG